ncbi:MAG: hypothetical protein JWQ76_4209, partial [Ramlibacter sp.]|nr:hypothetical protein [Ramlibacter sp.]
VATMPNQRRSILRPQPFSACAGALELSRHQVQRRFAALVVRTRPKHLRPKAVERGATLMHQASYQGIAAERRRYNVGNDRRAIGGRSPPRERPCRLTCYTAHLLPQRGARPSPVAFPSSPETECLRTCATVATMPNQRRSILRPQPFSACAGALELSRHKVQRRFAALVVRTRPKHLQPKAVERGAALMHQASYQEIAAERRRYNVGNDRRAIGGRSPPRERPCRLTC